MTRPADRQIDKVPESEANELHALYHAGSMDGPSPLLDANILEAARAELRADHVKKRPTPWWKRWLVPATGIAVGILGLSLTWRVMDEQELELRREMNAVESAPSVHADESKGTMAPANAPAAAQPSVSAQAPSIGSRAAESKPARSLPPPPLSPTPSAAPEQAAKKTLGATPQALVERQRAENSEAGVVGSSPAVVQGKLEAKRSAADSASESAASAPADPAARLADDAATPEAWLQHIRELRVAGRSADAVQSLVRFRERYPDQLLPDDLNGLK